MKLTFVAPADFEYKPQFFKLWEILLFIACVSALFVFFFPEKLLLQQVLEEEKSERITLAYLHRLLVLYPKQPQLMIAYISQQIGSNQLEQAEQELKSLNQDIKNHKEVNRWDILWLQYLIKLSKFYQYHLTESEKGSQTQQLLSMMTSFVDAPLDKQKLLRVASDAVALGHPAVALRIYQRLQNQNQLNREDEFIQGAAIAMQVSQYQAAAQFYLQAAKYTSLIPKKREYLRQALKTLQSGNLLLQAISEAEKLPPDILHDKAFLQYLAQLSLAAGRYDLAQNYIHMALKISSRKTS